MVDKPIVRTYQSDEKVPFDPFRTIIEVRWGSHVELGLLLKVVLNDNIFVSFDASIEVDGEDVTDNHGGSGSGSAKTVGIDIPGGLAAWLKDRYGSATPPTVLNFSVSAHWTTVGGFKEATIHWEGAIGRTGAGTGGDSFSTVVTNESETFTDSGSVDLVHLTF